MDMEPFAYLIIFLFLTLITFFARWLNEKIQEEIKRLDILGSSKKSKKQEDLETLETTATPQSRKKPISTTARRTTAPKRWIASRLDLRNKADLRQGIIMMTVLGPCRALEHPDN